MPRYRWATGYEWLRSAWRRGRISWSEVCLLLATIDSDTIQEHFQSAMDEDGYFDDLDAKEEDDEDDDTDEDIS